MLWPGISAKGLMAAKKQSAITDCKNNKIELRMIKGKKNINVK
jgi:hypothetical protein